jgi:hypothetical protein
VVPFLTICAGFFVYARVKKYRNRGKRDPLKPLASFSLSQTTVATSGTQSGGMLGSVREGLGDRGTKRQKTSSPLSHLAAGASPRAVAGDAKEDRDDHGVGRPVPPVQSIDLHHGPESIWVPPPSRRQLRLHSPSDQPREMPRIDEEPRFRSVAHPYQNTAHDSSTSLPADSQIQADELPLALTVSSHAGGIEPSRPSPPLSGKSLYSQSSYTHIKSDNGGTPASSSREPRVEPKPINTSNPIPPERKLSKSFLTFEDVETPSSSVPNLSGSQPSPAMLCLSPPLSYQTPATLYQSPALASSIGHTPNPNTRADAKKGGKGASRFMIVDAPYTPLLSDELPLNVGDIVRLLHAFDDGWCIVERNGATGAVPKICLKEWAQA